MAAYRVVVIGASSGGVEALKNLFGGLKPGVQAALFIVLHIPPDFKSHLPQLLSMQSPIPVHHAQDGGAIVPGNAYIAPPDRHLVLQQGQMHLVYGPKINHTRPAIDPLFESAASEYGSSAIGIILSGNLNDGTKGLMRIKEAGGLAVVQDPQDALFDSMPRSALRHVPVDYRLPVPKIAELLNGLTHLDRSAKGAPQMNQDFGVFSNDETSVIKKDFEAFRIGGETNQRSVLTCPDCGGVLWEMRDGDLVRYRCHTGHVYNAEVLISSQDNDLEKALWTAVRVLVEKAAVTNRLALVARESKDPELEAYYHSLAREAEEDLERIQKTLRNMKTDQARNPGTTTQADSDIPHPADGAPSGG
jgi:two-component system chemotaxis response regulator CheB